MIAIIQSANAKEKPKDEMWRYVPHFIFGFYVLTKDIE
jgi:hypothetical protein